jgi:PEP-CTERM/exosortase A-associated glycosyltransferase
MKVLHVLQYSLPSLMGYCIRSAGLMEGIRRHGIDVVAVTGAAEAGAKAPEEEIRGVRYYRTPASTQDGPSPVREWRMARALARRLDEVVAAERPELIHVHSPAYNGLVALRAARKLGVPCVYEMRAVWEDAAVDRGKFAEGSPIYRASRLLESRVLKGANAVVTICQGLRGEVVSRGIPEKKVFVAPNAVEPDAFAPLPRDEELASELGLQGRLVFGFIGSLFNYEGVEDILDAAPAVLARHPEAAFFILGGGEREAEVKAKVEALRDPRVVYRQRVPHSEVARYYAVVDCLVYARRRIRLTDLVTPLKPLEAMAMRKTVVASDVGGHREMVEHGVTGLIFDHSQEALVEALCRLVREPGLMDRLALAGREYALRERNWLRTTENHLRSYEYARRN